MATPNPQAAERPPGKPWSVAELSAHLSCSTRHLWRLIDAGKVRTIRLGRKVLVPDEEARRVATEGCR